MKNIPDSPIDSPATFRIRVRGRLNQDWINSLWENMVVDCDAGGQDVESIVQGVVIDQAQLLGIVNALYSRGYQVIALEEVAEVTTPEEAAHAESDTPLG